MAGLVLVLDDEKNIRNDLSKHINRIGYEVCPASTLEEANKIIQVEKIDFGIIDLKIDYSSDYGGIKVIENINKLQPSAKIIVLSAYELTDEVKKQLERVYYESFIPKGGTENYIKSIINELRRLKELLPQKTCFVIMPFSETESCRKEQWTEVYEVVIKPSVEESGYYYKCLRACLDVGNIIKDILVNVNRADIVIADVTDRNPNVFYELGVRHALRDATILITQDIKHVPFDLQPYAVVEYDWTTREGRNNFNKTISRVLAKLEDSPDSQEFTSPVREYLSLEGLNEKFSS